MGGLEELLEYRRGLNVRPLPAWAQYLVALGRFAVEHCVPGRRLVVGISLPTRAFAAAFAALGVSTAAYQDPEDILDPRAHFTWLTTLPAGTSIRLRRGRYLICARLLGVEVMGGVEHLTYQDSSKCYLPWDRCRSVQPLEPGEEFARRRPLTPNAEFVEAALGVDPFVHGSVTSLDCLIVGMKEALRQEVTEEEFVVRRSAGSVAGVLNDLLRCDAYELNANDHDRTAVISAFVDDVPERLLARLPPAVVFDGPAGYLRLRGRWRRSPWVVLLDRTSPSVLAAGDTFNQELALSVADAELSALGEPPSQFEIRAFYEAIR